VLIPVLVGEARDLAPAAARELLRWGARRIGPADQARRYEEEWLADLERVPGKATKLVHACSVVVLSVPRLRRQFRRGRRRALLPGWIANMAAGQLAGASQAEVSMQLAAGLLVPRFADHCMIYLFQGDALVCRAQRHAGDWTPPPGTWAQAGEQIRFPEGHFCQRAMAALDSVLVTHLSETVFPAPSVPSLAVAQQVGLKSVVAAPLYARGRLLGVMSIGISGLTGRRERFGPDDRDFMSIVARQVARAIDDATPSEACPGRPALAVGSPQAPVPQGRAALLTEQWHCS
jgi:hypothetical protein